MHNELASVVLFAVAVAGGCKERSKLDRPAPERAAANGGTPSTAPQGSASDDASPEAQAFCERTMQRVLACFDDAGFWDVFATSFFAKYPDTTGNPDAKQAWIGMRKDDIVGLRQDKQLVENCGVMVRTSRLPTAADMQAVDAVMNKSCTDFGTAMGILLFHKGVFHQPR